MPQLLRAGSPRNIAMLPTHMFVREAVGYLLILSASLQQSGLLQRCI